MEKPWKKLRLTVDALIAHVKAPPLGDVWEFNPRSQPIADENWFTKFSELDGVVRFLCTSDQCDMQLPAASGTDKYRKGFTELGCGRQGGGRWILYGRPGWLTRMQSFLSVIGAVETTSEESSKPTKKKPAAPTAEYLGEGRIIINGATPAVRLKVSHAPFVERLLKGHGVASTSELEKVASNPARTFKEICEGYAGRLLPFIYRPAEKDAGYSTSIKDCREVVSKS